MFYVQSVEANCGHLGEEGFFFFAKLDEELEECKDGISTEPSMIGTHGCSLNPYLILNAAGPLLPILIFVFFFRIRQVREVPLYIWRPCLGYTNLDRLTALCAKPCLQRATLHTDCALTPVFSSQVQWSGVGGNVRVLCVSSVFEIYLALSKEIRKGLSKAFSRRQHFTVVFVKSRLVGNKKPARRGTVETL